MELLGHQILLCDPRLTERQTAIVARHATRFDQVQTIVAEPGAQTATENLILQAATRGGYSGVGWRDGAQPLAQRFDQRGVKNRRAALDVFFVGDCGKERHQVEMSILDHPAVAECVYSAKAFGHAFEQESRLAAINRNAVDAE